MEFLQVYMKRWADRYRIQGEIKGGTIPLHHKVLLVAANISIE